MFEQNLVHLDAENQIFFARYRVEQLDCAIRYVLDNRSTCPGCRLKDYALKLARSMRLPGVQI